MKRLPLTGFPAFTAFWAGQSVSLLGTELSGFALGVWVYQTTGSATSFALTLVFGVLPGILVSPVAGVLVDRWPLRRVLIVSDAASALAKLALVALLAVGRLELWHVYLVEAVASVLLALQTPALGATTTLLVPEKHLGRASGMLSSGEAGATILGPLLAGLLIGPIGLAGVVLVDLATFLVALVALAVIRIPGRAPVQEAAEAPASKWRALTFGWSYIAARPGLLGLLCFGVVVNLCAGTMHALLTPTVLLLSTPAVLGSIFSFAGVGMLAGGAVMSAWGGPRRRMHGFFGAGALVAASFIVAGAWPTVAALGAGFILLNFTLPFLNGSTQPIWQTRTPPAVQGRVFAARWMVVRASMPLAFVLAGPLAERVFEPWMRGGGALADGVGRLIGTGPGRGTGLLFVVLGLLLLVALAVCALIPAVRRIEDTLPGPGEGRGEGGSPAAAGAEALADA